MEEKNADFEAYLATYDYAFPPELIATAPAHPRDSARLQVYNRKQASVTWASFAELADFLAPGTVLVLNDTKVIPARIQAVRSTGGMVSLLYLSHTSEGLLCMANRKLQVGEFLCVNGNDGCTVLRMEGRFWRLKPHFARRTVLQALSHYGSMPLPPYIKDSPLSRSQANREYQTVFAKKQGSVAAPTASLHFTKRLLQKLQHRGIQIVHVTLHVHLGTFSPLTAEQWQSGHLHTEWYSVSAQAAANIRAAKAEGKPIVAVGTTVVRTLESAAQNGQLEAGERQTDLFIRDNYRHRVVDGLITNYHVPKSSLMMLVSTFVGRPTLLELYDQAIAQRCRLFSFGDGMLIL